MAHPVYVCVCIVVTGQVCCRSPTGGQFKGGDTRTSTHI